ncbi:MAG: hypothetical protein M1817_005971 [Caeruleum heppii]|nr:MAG: hypothetical protein M1817_005971 [Caeruleum heppii]
MTYMQYRHLIAAQHLMTDNGLISWLRAPILEIYDDATDHLFDCCVGCRFENRFGWTTAYDGGLELSVIMRFPFPRRSRWQLRESAFDRRLSSILNRELCPHQRLHQRLADLLVPAATSSWSEWLRCKQCRTSSAAVVSACGEMIMLWVTRRFGNDLKAMDEDWLAQVRPPTTKVDKSRKILRASTYCK